MQIHKNCQVSFHYSLLDEKGKVVESSRESDALTFITDKNQIIPGLEAGLMGKTVGDKFQLKLKADQAYGQWLDEKVYDIEANLFSQMSELELGLVCTVTNPQGEDELVSVIGISDELITVDANHRYAGLDLKFSVEVMQVSNVSD